jgi:Cu-processing system permease protein
MDRIIRFVMGDIVRNRIVVFYMVLLLLFTLGLFILENRPEKAMLSMLNVVLILVPLVSIIFSTIYYYNSSEFIELVLAQPVGRKRVLLVEFAGLSLSLVLAFLIGGGLPLLLYDQSAATFLLILAGIGVTVIFVSLAFLGSVLFRDKARGIGLALLIWFFFALIFDGLLLLILYNFSDYPLEKPMLVFTMLNPIDIARMLVITKMDAAALMGHSGEVFRDFLTTFQGWLAAGAALLVWAMAPLWGALRIFERKDL